MPFPSEKRIEEIDRIIKSQTPIGTRTITYKDEVQKIDVYKIPMEYLIFNRYNGRINIDMDSDQALTPDIEEEYSTDLENKIISYLWESAIGPNRISLKDIEAKGQLEAGIITKDGVIVDGNRRAMLLKKSETKGDFFNAGILTDEYSEDSAKAVRKLETTLQFDQDQIVDFGPLAKYLTTQKLKDNDGYSFKEIEGLFGQGANKGDPESWYKIFKVMTDYLDFIGSPGIYSLLRISDKKSSKEQGFIDAEKILRLMNSKGGLKTDSPMNDQKRSFRNMMFQHIRAESIESPQAYKLLCLGREKSGLLHHKNIYDETYEELKDITRPIEDVPPLRDYIKENPQMDIKDAALKRENEVKEIVHEPLKELFLRATNRARDAASKDKPEIRILKVLDEVKKIEEEKEKLSESENISAIENNIRLISKFVEKIKRELGL